MHDTDAGAADSRAYEAETTTETTYETAGTAHDAALALASMREHEDEEYVVGLITAFDASPLFALALKDFHESSPHESLSEERIDFKLKLFAARFYLAGRIDGRYGWGRGG